MEAEDSTLLVAYAKGGEGAVIKRQTSHNAIQCVMSAG